MPYHWVDPLTLFPPHLVSQGSGSGAVSPLSYAGSGWSLGWTKAHEVLAAALCGKIPSLLTQGSLCLLRLPCLVSWPVTSTPLHYHGLAKKQLLFCPVGRTLGGQKATAVLPCGQILWVASVDALRVSCDLLWINVRLARCQKSLWKNLNKILLCRVWNLECETKNLLHRIVQ